MHGKYTENEDITHTIISCFRAISVGVPSMLMQLFEYQQALHRHGDVTQRCPCRIQLFGTAPLIHDFHAIFDGISPMCPSAVECFLHYSQTEKYRRHCRPPNGMPIYIPHVSR